MICPRCDGQGEIYKAQVIGLEITLFICDECEASWKEGQEISVNTFEDLSTFLDKYGIKYQDAKIIDLGYEF